MTDHKDDAHTPHDGHQAGSETTTPVFSWPATILLCATLFITTGLLVSFIFSTEPTAQREGAEKKTAMLVDVITAQAGNFRPTLAALGTVIPKHTITLSAQVAGEVRAINSAFEPGAFFKKGQTLLTLDAGDYRERLRLRQSELAQAQANLAIEQGEQNIARKEYNFIEQSLSDERKALVLREPQLAIAKARVRAARSDVRLAQRALARTKILAPFDGFVVERSVNEGGFVGSGDALAELVNTDYFWVKLALPLDKLMLLDLPVEGQVGPVVKLFNNSARDQKSAKAGSRAEPTYREGRLYRLVNRLNENIRMASVLVQVKDPLALNENKGAQPILIGSYLKAHIPGKLLEDVVRLPRDTVRANDTLWVMQAGKLDIRTLDIVAQDAQYAYVKAGVSAGEQIVVSQLSSVTQGAKLRTAPADAASVSTPSQKDDGGARS